MLGIVVIKGVSMFCPMINNNCKEQGCTWWDSELENCTVNVIRDSLCMMAEDEIVGVVACGS